MATAASAPDIDATTLRRWLWRGQAVLIDVREREEYSEEHIPGASLMPLSAFDPCLVSATRGRPQAVLYGLAGSRSAKAAAALLVAGYPAPATLSDGLLGWKDAGLRTESRT
ncbi:MAG: rhodanese-like domain-containing protein [Pseudomonadota bacterium]